MDYTLVMNFITSNGEKTSISLDGIKQDIVKAEAIALMDKIIEKDIFFTKNGSLVKRHSAQIVTKQVTKFEFQ